MPIPTAFSAAAPASPVDVSVAERLFSGFRAIENRLTSLEPSAVALNLALTIAVAALAAGVTWLLSRLLRSGLDRLAQKGLIRTEQPEGRPKVAKLTWVLLRALIVGVAIAAVLSIWGFDILGWFSQGGGGSLARILMLVVVGVGIVELISHLLDRSLHKAASSANDPRRAQQIRTLGPLVRTTAIAVVTVALTLTLLSELGVQIAPLLASAGVLGLAIGFGAQTLVKDFLTGVFLIVEDIVAIGDNIRVGESVGTVEAMTIRTLRIRNMDGTLHILPYSEAQVIHNRTKTFSAYIFNIGVGYGADLDKALAIMTRVGSELQADPVFSDKILGPLEVLGVDALGDFAVMLKARFRTRPQEQWRVGRAYNKRIKEAFDAEGIDIPFPTQTLRMDAPPADNDADDDAQPGWSRGRPAPTQRPS